MRCLLLVVAFVLCSAMCASAAPWIADISEFSEVPSLEEGPDRVSIWLPSGERATVGIYGGSESIRVDAPPEVGAKTFVQFIWEREVFRSSDDIHVARIPYWLPSRRWRPPGQETGGPYAVQLHAKEPGDYEVAIRCRNGDVLTVELHVVESVPEPDMGFGYYTSPSNWKYKQYRQYFQHMSDLRCNTFTIFSSHPTAMPPAPEGVEYTAVTPILQETRARNIAAQMDLAVETGLTDGKVPVFVFCHHPPDLDDAYKYGRYVDQWPELLGYGRDEPPMSDKGEWEARGMTLMFNNNGAQPYRSGSAMCDLACYRFGDGIDIWMPHMQRMSDTLRREAERQGKELWSYCCGMRGTNAPLNRYLAGWWSFKVRPRAVLYWCYMDTMLSYGLEEPSSVQEDGKWTPCGYFEFCLGAPDGPISSVGAEARRDGIVDYMVLRELERTIIAARVNQADDLAYYKLLKEAATWLQDQTDRVDTNFWPNDEIPEGNCEPPQSCHWDARDLAVPPIQDFNALRRQAIEYTQTLRDGSIAQ